MEAVWRLADLGMMHPRLLWEDLAGTAAAVLQDSGSQAPYRFEFEYQDVPGFANGRVHPTLDTAGISPEQVVRLRRTYEPFRLVELAAIAVAGLALYHGGGHEIRDLAVRGSGADYLVDEPPCHLEIVGRSRRSDFGTAWQQKWQRLADRAGQGFYVCVIEFETPAGRLGFAV